MVRIYTTNYSISYGIYRERTETVRSADYLDANVNITTISFFTKNSHSREWLLVCVIDIIT